MLHRSLTLVSPPPSASALQSGGWRLAGLRRLAAFVSTLCIPSNSINERAIRPRTLEIFTCRASKLKIPLRYNRYGSAGADRRPLSRRRVHQSLTAGPSLLSIAGSIAARVMRRRAVAEPAPAAAFLILGCSLQGIGDTRRSGRQLIHTSAGDVPGGAICGSLAALRGPPRTCFA